MTEHFRLWNNYVDQKVVYIEGMDYFCKLSPGRLKQLCDVHPIQLEKTGSVLRNIRPLIQIFTSNYTPAILYDKAWDAAQLIRFSSKRWAGKTKNGHKWSGDRVVVANTDEDMVTLYQSMRAMFPGLDIPLDLSHNWIRLYNDPEDWPDLERLIFKNPTALLQIRPNPMEAG